MPLSHLDIASLSRLLEEAMDLEPSQVETWLAGLPADKSHLRSQLRDMLDAHFAGSGTGFMADGPSLPGGPSDETVARANELVGPYRLIREIGRGGMGAVWLAERADGTLKRHIALKLPRLVWGAGLAERMARERDIGALLEYPNIARLYDAGVDERGRPYLALEYIDGQPLDAWCEAQALSVRERLRLFVQVARAVAYAHGRLVVHRDLKPSNVLVTEDGQAHLLDFGIAKLLCESGPGDEHITRDQGRALTPHYASPEQIQGEIVTVASDVYSLGVLLYELLTGGYPYGPERKTLGAIEHAILTEEAIPASSQVNDPQTARALRGEVDAILAMALRRKPDERYATAIAFAEDIERHLKGEAVLARPDSRLYRLRKSIWRHRVAFGTVTAVVCAVVLGAGMSLVQAHRANKEAERARVVKEFVVDVFKINSPTSTETSELRKLPARMLLDRGAKLVETRFAGQPSLQAELYGVIGGIFLDMGAPDVAEQYATRQVTALGAAEEGPSQRANALLLLAQAYLDSKRYRDAELQIRRAMDVAVDSAQSVHARIMLAETLEKLGRIRECERELATAEAALSLTAGKPNVDRAVALKLRATLLTNANRFDEAVLVLKDATEEALSAEGALSRTAIDIRIGLARELLHRFRLEESRSPAEAALAALRTLGGVGLVRAALEEAQLTMNAYENQLLKFDDARAVVRRARNEIAASDHAAPESILAKIDLYLGWLELNWGNVAEADRLVSSAASHLQPDADALGDRYQLTLGMAAVASMTGHHDVADTQFRALADLRQRMGRANSPFSAEDYAAIAENLGMQGRYQQGLDLLATAPKFERVQGMAAGGEQTEALLGEARARLLLASGQAVSALRELPEEPMTAFSDGHRRIRGEAMCVAGRPEEGLSMLLSVIDFFAPNRYEFDPIIARDRAVAGLCALAAGKRPLAQQLARLSSEAFKAQPVVSEYFKAPQLKLEHDLGNR